MHAWSPTWTPEPAEPQAKTLDQWSDLPEDAEGEFVDGCLTKEEVPDPAHESTVAWFIVLLGTWLRGRGGFLFGSEAKLQVSARRGRKADVVVYLPGSAPPPRRGLLKAPPSIVVEVITPTPRDERRDRVEKMDEYATFGVPYYWLVDPALGSFELFALTPNGQYARARAATEGRLTGIPGCPDLVVDLDDLWRELDRLAADA